MKSRRLAGLAICAALAGCSGHAPPSAARPPSPVPPGWIRHTVNGVTVAAPPGWRIGPDPVCAPVPADTIGVIKSEDRAVPPGGAVQLGSTNCAAQQAPSPGRSPSSSAWVSIDCVLASRVALPGLGFLGTAGRAKVLRAGSDPFYVVGQRQAIAVAAGDDAVAQQILRTVVPSGLRC